MKLLSHPHNNNFPRHGIGSATSFKIPATTSFSQCGPDISEYFSNASAPLSANMWSIPPSVTQLTAVAGKLLAARPEIAAASDQLYKGKTAIVVGAGPAGSTAAMMLAKNGFEVEVGKVTCPAFLHTLHAYHCRFAHCMCSCLGCAAHHYDKLQVYERRPEPQLDAVATGRAYIILLIPRGQAALQRLGIPLPNDDNYKSLGTVRHDSKGKVSVSKEEGNITFSRTDLAQFLVDQARARYPDSIHYNFQATATQFDIPGRKASHSSTADSPGCKPAASMPCPAQHLFHTAAAT
ncbi:monooxygenase [Haematococcus lacustris]|uniref:Monooxygenase n=1 Tax=Haematococcus lacustris TaxID=44745 RepID=A0A699YDC8_HAELA|nr:monooxygenase [Haematococcus lacustris]